MRITCRGNLWLKLSYFFSSQSSRRQVSFLSFITLSQLFVLTADMLVVGLHFLYFITIFPCKSDIQSCIVSVSSRTSLSVLILLAYQYMDTFWHACIKICPFYRGYNSDYKHNNLYLYCAYMYINKFLILLL